MGSALVHGAAAIDIQDLSGDVRGGIAGEKKDRTHQILRRQGMAERVFSELFFENRFALVPTGLGGVGDPRTDRVHGDVIGPQLARKGFDEADDPRL